MENQKVYEIRLITLGEGSVGKTSMINRFIHNSFGLNYLATIGLDFKHTKISLDDKTIINLKIFDTAGEERFRTISVNYIRNTDGILLIYDITNMESFNSVENWMETISNCRTGMPIILVGNKTDLAEKRAVNSSLGEKKAEKIGIKFFETSCLTGEKVHESFMEIIRDIAKIHEEKGLYKIIEKNKNKNYMGDGENEDNKEEGNNGKGNFKLNKKNKGKGKKKKCC